MDAAHPKSRAPKGGSGAGDREVKFPPYEQVTLDNGLRVIAAERGRLPLVSMRLVFPAGSASDPEGKKGLADFTTRLMRRGVEGMGAEEVDEAVEFVGASLGLGASEESLTVSISAPAEQLEAMLDVLARLVRTPTFVEREVEAAKKRLLAQLASDLDDPSTVAERALLHALYGEHPYGHDVSGTVGDVRTFTRDDVIAFHQRHIGPKVGWLVVVGAVPSAKVIELARRFFESFDGGPSEAPSSPALARASLAGRLLLVNKPEQTQCQVRIGGLAFPKGHPDSYPALLVESALGGGFTSRLVNEIRVNRGLSYGAHASFDKLKVTGTFAVSSFTKTETARELIDVALTEVRRMREKGPTPKELQVAKPYLAGLFPMRMETNEAIAGALADLRLHDLPDEWVERYRQKVHAVTLAQAREVARKYLLPDPPAIVLVGNAEALTPQLKGFDVVQVEAQSFE